MTLSKLNFTQKPLVMGIVNVTPDSFSDGGSFYNKNNAIEHGLKLLEEGADILDIGGESTRPGAEAVDIEEEILRVVPVVSGLKQKAKWISIDSRNAKTIEAALEAGANIINDVSALTHDSESINVALRYDVPVILMHSKGLPADMQNNPQYNNVLDEVYDYLSERISSCMAAGIEKSRIIVDPGIGFGKSLEHNLIILKNLDHFKGLGCPILLGASRKSFISMIMKGAGVEQRLGGSIASVLIGAQKGASIVRVHDVYDSVQALQTYYAIEDGV